MGHPKGLLLPVLLTLGACSVKPLVPYVEPASSTATANLRVITNGDVRGTDYPGCLKDSKGLAKAGRFSDGQPSINYPQAPLHPRQLGMPQRLSPEMPQYLGATRMAEGQYTEISAEYRVPAGAPFLLESLGLAAGSYGSTYLTCPPVKQVFQFEPGKNYEAYVGLVIRQDTEGNGKGYCAFSVYELVPLGNTKLTLPSRLEGRAPIENACPQR